MHELKCKSAGEIIGFEQSLLILSGEGLYSIHNFSITISAEFIQTEPASVSAMQWAIPFFIRTGGTDVKFQAL